MNKSLENVYMKNAEQILKENNISLEPPIDLDGLVKKLGIRVREHDFASVEEKTGLAQDSILGATISMNSDVTILYKKYKEPRNNHGTRFTIAHEIGHCALHTDNLIENHIELRNDLYNKYDEREQAAARFAGELLMPKESLMNIYNRLVLPSVKTLAEIFDVSISVMEERLKELNLICYDMKENIG